MRILFYQWGTFNESVIESTMRELGHFVRVNRTPYSNNGESDSFVHFISQAIREYHADIVFTIDYFPLLAVAAKQSEVLYYSWIFHLPQWNLFSNQAQLPNNRIFCFDSAQEQELKLNNISTARYMSLAADKKLLSSALNRAGNDENVEYACDISFVGTLYESKYNYFNKISEEARQTKTYERIIDLIRRKRFTYGRAVLYRDIDDDITTFLTRETELEMENYYFARQEEIAVMSVLARKITVEERKAMVRAVAKRFDFKLYSNSVTKKYPEINNCGPVKFASQSPLIFAQSKINLYVTPRAIRTGIPLRVLEIMACGGFVLTNYQEDLAKEFGDKKEVVMYHSLEDLLEKAAYYLEHEEERRQIAHAGSEKVLREYNYAEKLRKMLEQH